MRPTIRQVAENAQVSRMTVSNVLRGRDSEASPETRERVMESVRNLGYVPVNPPSRQSTHVPTRIIGLFYEAIKLDEYWGFQTSLGLHEGAILHNYDLLTMLRTRGGEAIGEAELRFLDRRSDGFIFLGPVGRADLLRTMVQQEIPIVTAYTDENIEGVASVTVNNAGAMALAVNHLVELGHHNIAFVGGELSRSDFAARRIGFEQAARAAGCRPHLTTYDIRADKWTGPMVELIEKRQVTAVVCDCDYAALALLEAAAQHDLLAPRDFSVTGMDDIPSAIAQNLTTVRYTAIEIGRHAMAAINYRLAGDPVEDCNFVIPVELEVRQTTSPPRILF